MEPEKDEMDSENILKTIQHIVQDVVSPDVRELKARAEALQIEIASLQKQIDERFASAESTSKARFAAADARVNGLEAKMDARFDALEAKMDARFDILLAAIRQSRAETELTSVKLFAALSERVAVLESQQRHQ